MRQFMGVTFSRPDFDVDYESECYSREQGCFFELTNVVLHMAVKEFFETLF